MKVVIYIRVSTQEQTENYSIGEQTEQLQKYAELMGWTVVETFIDGGYTGSNIYRPALQDMMHYIKTNNVDRVLVHKLDRLSRSIRDTMFLVEDVFQKNNTELISLTDSIDTASTMGKTLTGILALYAQFERERIAERMTMGREARAKDGYYTGAGTIIIGYDYVDSELLVNEYEAMLVNQIFDMFIKGTPIKTIEKTLNKKGMNHRHGKWHDITIKRLLQNRHYIGEVKFGGKWYQGKHTSIVSEEVFNKAQSLLKYRKDNYKYDNKHSSYLTGFMWCAQCGARYHRQCWKPKMDNTKTAIYTCYSRSKKLAKMVKDPNCMNKNYPVEELENIIFTEIRKLDNTDSIERIRHNENKDNDNNKKIALIKGEIKDLSNQISKLMDLYSISGITIEDVDKKIEPLAVRRTKLVKELEILTSEEESGLTNEEIFDVVATFEKALEENNLDDVRLAISTLIKRIEIDEEDVFIHWNFA